MKRLRRKNDFEMRELAMKSLLRRNLKAAQDKLCLTNHVSTGMGTGSLGLSALII
jgi:hypothetical protein